MSKPKVEDITPGNLKGEIARNLVASPITLSNLDGDKYDYNIVLWTRLTGVSVFKMFPNNDTSASNYRRYQMYGGGSSAAASQDDASTYGLDIGYIFGASNPGLHISRLTGKTGGERHLHCLQGWDQSGTRYVINRDNYWKNTVDNITSLVITTATSATATFNIRIYRTLKETSLEDYELVKEVDISSRDLNANPVIFGGVSDTEGVEVDGDLYGEYVLDYDLDVSPNFRLNNDTGTNYLYQRLQNIDGTLSAVTNTLSLVANTLLNGTFTFSTDKQYGYRVMNGAPSKNTTGTRQQNSSQWWLNSVDNLTEIRVVRDTTVSATGKIRLYRKKPKGSFDGMPWELVKRHEFDGDFSSGYTFSNLDGDNTFLYKVKGLIKETAGGANRHLLLEVNADATGSNYLYQYLVGNGTSATAGAATTGLFLTVSESATPSQGEMYIYPRSGYSRPILNVQDCYLDTPASSTYLQYFAWQWTNTVDNITSIVAKCATAATVKGYIELYRIPLN